MIRTTRLKLYETKKKSSELDKIYFEYKRVVCQFIDILWSRKNPRGSFVDKETYKLVDTWMSSRLKQHCGKIALQIVKSSKSWSKKVNYRKYKKVYSRLKERGSKSKLVNLKWKDWINEVELRDRIKPHFDGNMELNANIFELQLGKNTFDYWMRMTSIGEKMKLTMPMKSYDRVNKLVSDGWSFKKSCRLVKVNGDWFVDLFMEKEEEKVKEEGEVIGIDLGINKLVTTSSGEFIGDKIKDLILSLYRKVRGSKSYRKKLRELKNYIGECVNKIDLTGVKSIVLEDLKNITIGTKKRVGKKTRQFLSYWNKKLVVDKIRNRCGVNRIGVHFVSPRYTSQKCPSCHVIDGKSRDGESYVCRSCGFSADADLVGATNIRSRFLREEFIVSPGKKILTS